MTATKVGEPGPEPGDRTASAVRAWVALYTSGLPAADADERRALLEADLWDEAQAAEWMGETSSLAHRRLSRWARGMPADISWRVERQRQIMKMPRRADMRISKVQLAAIGAVTILYLVLLVGGLTQSDFREWAGMPISVVGLALSIVGLLVAIPRPQAGFAIGLIGTVVSFLAMPWLFPFYLPLLIVLGYRALSEQGRARSTVSD